MSDTTGLPFISRLAIISALSELVVQIRLWLLSIIVFFLNLVLQQSPVLFLHHFPYSIMQILAKTVEALQYFIFPRDLRGMLLVLLRGCHLYRIRFLHG